MTMTPMFRLPAGFPILVALPLVLGAAGDAHGQERHYDLVPRSVTFSPRSGPPGTVVKVVAANLPSVTPVYVTLGGTGMGFEVLSQMLITNPTGDLTETVEIPEWANQERLHLFVVVDAYFGRLIESPPFHVTGPDGVMARRATILRVEGACAIVESEHGETFAVTGYPVAPARGAEVDVRGTVEEGGPCPGSITVRASRLTVRGAPF